MIPFRHRRRGHQDTRLRQHDRMCSREIFPLLHSVSVKRNTGGQQPFDSFGVSPMSAVQFGLTIQNQLFYGSHNITFRESALGGGLPQPVARPVGFFLSLYVL